MYKANGCQSSIDVPEECHDKKPISAELKALTRSRKRIRFFNNGNPNTVSKIRYIGWRLQLAKGRNDWSVRKINVVAQVHCKLNPC